MVLERSDNQFSYGSHREPVPGQPGLYRGTVAFNDQPVWVCIHAHRDGWDDDIPGIRRFMPGSIDCAMKAVSWMLANYHGPRQ